MLALTFPPWDLCPPKTWCQSITSQGVLPKDVICTSAISFTEGFVETIFWPLLNLDLHAPNIIVSNTWLKLSYHMQTAFKAWKYYWWPYVMIIVQQLQRVPSCATQTIARNGYLTSLMWKIFSWFVMPQINPIRMLPWTMENSSPVVDPSI